MFPLIPIRARKAMSPVPCVVISRAWRRLLHCNRGDLAACVALLLLPFSAIGQTTNLSSEKPGRIATEYAITSSMDLPTSDPKAWRVFGSKDGVNWTLLDTRTNEQFTVRCQRRVYEIKNPDAYTSYYINIDSTWEYETTAANLSEFELIGPVVGVSDESQIQAVYSASRAHPLIGEASHAFDNNPSTKWLDYGYAVGDCWLMCEYVAHAQETVTNTSRLRILLRKHSTDSQIAEKSAQILSNLMFTTTRPMRALTAYAITSANDTPARDPRDWRLLGSNDGGKTWDTIDSRQNESFTTRFQRRLFALHKPAAYAIYRLQFDSVGNPGSANSIQIGEIELVSSGTNAPNFSLAVSADAENPPMESSEMAFDGDPKSKWLAFHSGSNNRHWIQWQYLPRDEDLPVISLMRFTRAARSGTRSDHARGFRIARTLTGYALISANDEPTRDPSAWRVLGSNNDGRTWTTLDVRTNQFFAARLQRREFKVANTNAYKSYRMQIDAIAHGTKPYPDCVQLADIEAVYAPDSSQTQFATIVSARGDYAPHEAAEKAFDADSGTKWLDFLTRGNTGSWIQWEFDVARGGRSLFNARELASSRSQANPVNALLNGVAVASVSSDGLVGFVDETGFQIVKLVPPLEVNPGSRIELSGVLQFGHGIPILTSAKSVMLAPLPTGALDDIPASGRFMNSTVEGRIGFVSRSELYSTIRINPGNGAATLTAHIFNCPESLLRGLRGARVRLRGVLETVYDESAERVPGVLWVSGLKDIEWPRLTDIEWSAWPEFPLTTLSNAPAGELVRVRGRIASIGNGHVILREEGFRIDAEMESSSALTPGDYIEVLGVLARDGSTNRLRFAVSRPSAPAIVDDIHAPVPGAYRSVLGIAAINEELAANPTEVFSAKIRGVITYIDLGLGGFYVQNGADSILVADQLAAGLSPFLKQEGLFVELTGWVYGTNHPALYPYQFATILGKGRMPEPLRHSWDYLMTGSDDGKWVEIEGVVSSVEKQRLTLIVKGGRMVAWVNDFNPATQEQVLGSLVRVQGVCSAVLNSRNQRLSSRLLVPSSEFIEIVNAAPENPFDIPLVPVQSVMQSQPVSAGLAVRFVKVNGVVTHTAGRSLFVQDGTDGVRIQLRHDSEVAVGDRVEAVGIPEPDGFAPRLAQALVKKVGTAPMPRPIPISPSMIGLTATGTDADMHDGTRVTMEAIYLGHTFKESSLVLELREDVTKKTFYAYLPDLTRGPPSIPPGSKVRLTGVFKADPEAVIDVDQAVSSFSLFLNSPADVAILTRAPWWTLQRTMWILAGSGAALLAVLAWVGLLRKRVRQRTSELRAEIDQHKRTEKQLQEEIAERKRMETAIKKSHEELLVASRHAGMAEVATSVLHNVGNVLNSVNISAAVIAEHVKKSRIGNLARVVALLRENSDNLGAFLERDPKGRQLPGYLDQLATHCAEERSTLAKEVHTLEKNIDHIKDIVVMQQTYARVSGLVESVSLAELAEDAIRMNAGTLASHDVRILREFDPRVPTVTVEKHKVLQILVNLIRNARFACDESGRPDKWVRVGLRERNGIVRITVCDNGVGIPPENITRIFNHGFTTRKGGHGFGLHSGAIAAKEMGGELSVFSDGPGTGATFTLELPLNPPAPDSKGNGRASGAFAA